MAISAFGIDLGTYNIKIYNGFNETISSQKNMIAIQKVMNKKNLFAYGDHAFETEPGLYLEIDETDVIDDGISARHQYSCDSYRSGVAQTRTDFHLLGCRPADAVHHCTSASDDHDHYLPYGDNQTSGYDTGH